MKISINIIVVQLIASALIIGCTPTFKTKKPNIILLLVDDMGWSDLECYAHDGFHETPNIDQLAQEGIRFTDAYATCSVCSPTRASIMTGKYPARLKITNFIPGHNTGKNVFITPKYKYELPLEEVIIAERLKTIGYDTYNVGKWHLGENEQYWPEHQGFDINIGGHSKGAPGSYYLPYAKFTHTIDWTVINLSEGHKNGDYLTDKLTDDALMLIEKSVKKEKPFFLNMSYYTVHKPLEGKLNLVKKYKDKYENGDYPFKQLHYAAMIQSLDESVGRIVNKLKELDIEKETLILFISDNGGQEYGEANGNAPLRKGKGTFYEGGIRVPFIMHWPGKIIANRISDEIVILTDIFPTIMEVVFGHNSDKFGVDGVSLVSLFDDPKNTIEREDIYWHFPHFHNGKPVSVIRSGDFKLMEFLEDNHFELYHLKSDIGESRSLAGLMPEKVKELHEKLDKWKKSIDAAPLLRKTPENEKFARNGSVWDGTNNIKNPPVFKKLTNGMIELYTFNEAKIRYTLDGTDPDKSSYKYELPLDNREGLVIRAKSWSPGGITSDVEEFLVPFPNVRAIKATSTKKPLSFATDTLYGSYWESEGIKLPQEIIFDLGKVRKVKRFLYQPARRIKYDEIKINSLKNNVDGAIKEYEIYISYDKIRW